MLPGLHFTVFFSAWKCSCYANFYDFLYFCHKNVATFMLLPKADSGALAQLRWDPLRQQLINNSSPLSSIVAKNSILDVGMVLNPPLSNTTGIKK